MSSQTKQDQKILTEIKKHQERMALIARGLQSGKILLEEAGLMQAEEIRRYRERAEQDRKEYLEQHKLRRAKETGTQERREPSDG